MKRLRHRTAHVTSGQLWRDIWHLLLSVLAMLVVFVVLTFVITAMLVLG